MKFWASAEVHQPASKALVNAQRDVEAFLNQAFSVSILRDVKLHLMYVPIVMPQEMRLRYPARTRLRRDARTSECAPQLNYDIFVSGTYEQQLREYLKGIMEAADHLGLMGATNEQVAEFQSIVSEAADRILAEHPNGHTRH